MNGSMPTNIDHASLLNDYYFKIEDQFIEFLEDVNQAAKWQLIAQTRDLDEYGNDYYEFRPFQLIKENLHHGTMTYEDEMNEVPVFYDGYYIPARYAHLTDE
jgi:hypothetical protein